MQQSLSYLPTDDERLCPPDCVLVSKEGTELPAHQTFLFMQSKDLGKMVAVARHDGRGRKSLQVSWHVSAACPPSLQLLYCVPLQPAGTHYRNA